MGATKPLGTRAYGSIGHLPDSRFGDGDHHIAEGQARILCERTRDRHDRVVVEEKLDGSCVAVAKIGGKLVPLTRAGYAAIDSYYLQHHLFHGWATAPEQLARFDALLSEGERVGAGGAPDVRARRHRRAGGGRLASRAEGARGLPREVGAAQQGGWLTAADGTWPDGHLALVAGRPQRHRGDAMTVGGTTRAAHLAGIIVAGLAFWLSPGMPTYRALVVLIGGIWAVGLIGSAVGSIRRRLIGSAVGSIRCRLIGSAARSILDSAHKITRQR